MNHPDSYDHRQRPKGPGPGQPAEPQAMPWLLPNPDDDPAVHATLDSADARARGILLIRLSPFSTTVTHLVQDTLRALGLPHTTDRLNVTDQLPRLLTYRLCGQGTTVLAIDCPHPLTPHQLRCARRWCDHLQAQLVLITTDPHPANPTAPTAGLTTTAAALLLRTPRRDPASYLAEPDLTTQATQLTGLTLPGDEFTTFRTSCLRLLPRHADTIDTLYTHAYQQAHDHARNRYRRPSHRPSGTDDTPDDRLADQIARAHAAVFHALTLGDPTAPIRLIRLRATQAALFTHHRVLLRWNPPTPTHAPHTALPGSLTPRDHATALAHNLNPTSAARTLLCGLFELSWQHEKELRTHEIIIDPPELLSGNLELRIPIWAQPFLYAHRCAHDHHSRDHNLYFPHHLDTTPHILSPRLANYQPVDGAARHHPTHEPRSCAASPNDPPPAVNILDNWLHRRHLTITPLPIPAPET